MNGWVSFMRLISRVCSCEFNSQLCLLYCTLNFMSLEFFHTGSRLPQRNQPGTSLSDGHMAVD